MWGIVKGKAKIFWFRRQVTKMGLTIKKVYFTVILQEVYSLDHVRRERGIQYPLRGVLKWPTVRRSRDERTH
jgi:hypothetical protein